MNAFAPKGRLTKKAFEAASGRPVPYEIVTRRPGDIAECFANPATAEKLLGWNALFGIDRMCVDHWRWQAKNPRGFQLPRVAPRQTEYAPAQRGGLREDCIKTGKTPQFAPPDTTDTATPCCAAVAGPSGR